MKLLRLITLAALLWSGALRAQTDSLKNFRLFIGGGMQAYGSINREDVAYNPDRERGFLYTITPVFGIQINSKTAAGVRLSFGGGSNDLISERLTAQNLNLGIGVFSRHTLLQKGRLMLLLEPSFDYRGGYRDWLRSVNGLPILSRDKFTGFNVSVSPLFAYRLFNRWRLMAAWGEIGYDYERIRASADPNYKERNGLFTARFGLQSFVLGAEFLF